jgi:hypothetical protein
MKGLFLSPVLWIVTTWLVADEVDDYARGAVDALEFAAATLLRALDVPGHLLGVGERLVEAEDQVVVLLARLLGQRVRVEVPNARALLQKAPAAGLAVLEHQGASPVAGRVGVAASLGFLRELLDPIQTARHSDRRLRGVAWHVALQ